MKLLSFRTETADDQLGVLIGAMVHAVDLELPDGTRLNSSSALIRNFNVARELIAKWLVQEGGTASAAGRLETLELNSPVVRPPLLLDCSAAPRHLQQAAVTLISRSLPSLLRKPSRPLIREVSKRILARALGDGVTYYKGRTTSVVGGGSVVPWPSYTSFLDPEPELAVVVGDIACHADRETVSRNIIGYTIFNDVSARDVQLREMIGGGLSMSKDMDSGNVLGPIIVTPDELSDPLSLTVTLSSDRGRRWVGSTSDYSMHPITLVHKLAQLQSLASGTVIGLGTVADTCGMERDEWIMPGETVVIEFEGIGSLTQTFGIPEHLDEWRWGGRSGCT